MVSELYAAHRKKLQRTALRILHIREQADDVVQDAYLRLLENGLPAGLRDVEAYLVQMVRHLAIDCHRRRQFEQQLFTGEDAGNEAVALAVAEDGAISRQALAMAVDALTQMSARTRRAFELHRLEGCSQRDVARELGVSATLVNFMIRDADTALGACRACLQAG